MASRRHGPCGCFGISLEHGSQCFAIFDIISGLLLFLVFGIIFLTGEKGLIEGKGFFPSEKFSIPRQLVITLFVVGYYNAITGLFLYFSVGFKAKILCQLWILLNTPLILVDFIKIYEIFVVYRLCKAIKQGLTETIDNDEEGVDVTNIKDAKSIK